MQSKSFKFPWLFLLLSFGISWILWIPVVLTGLDYQTSPLLVALVLLGVFGPGLAAILLTYQTRDIVRIRDFWQRTIDIKRIRLPWVWIILFLWPVLHGIAILITRFFNVVIPESELLEQILSQPLTIPVVLLLYFIQAGVEELGWRGYLLEELQAKLGASASSLLIGILHTIWHLPLFWMVGTNQIKMGFGLEFLIFIIFVIASSVFSTWCYLGNGHSILAITLLHTTGNLSFDFFAYAPGSLKHQIYVVLMVIGALILLAYFQRKGWGKTNPA